MFSLAVKCQVMEKTYSKNTSVITGKFNIIGLASNLP
jgi:hypothetical protein